MTTTVALTAFSCKGLIAHYFPNERRYGSSKAISLLDPSVALSDPFYHVKIPLSLHLQDRQIVLLQWNSHGTHLLVLAQDGSLEIFALKSGLANLMESLYFRAATLLAGNYFSGIWCENRRKFQWNSTSMNAQAQSSSRTASLSSTFFTSKAFSVDFLKPGLLGFVLARDNGLEVFLQCPTTTNQILEFTQISINLDDELGELNLPESILAQRSNGTILFLARRSCSLSLYEISETNSSSITNTNTTTNNNNINCTLIGRVQNQKQEGKEKFIWWDVRDCLIHLKLANHCSEAHIQFLNSSLENENEKFVSFSTSESSLSLNLNEIFHSSRAAGYFFGNPHDDATTCFMTNLTGESGKYLKFDGFGGVAASDVTDFGPLTISPNGLCVGRVGYFESFPIFNYAIVGDLNHKNISVIREFVGKMVSSSLNGVDFWDIFQVIKRTALHLFRKSSDNSGHFNFLSTLLSEWISLLDLAGIPARDFYGKLLELFKNLSFDDRMVEIYKLTDSMIYLSSVEKIILASFPAFTEDHLAEQFNTFALADNLEFELSALIPLLPVIEGAINHLMESFHENSSEDPETWELKGLMMAVEDDAFRCIGLALSASEAALKLLSSLTTDDQQNHHRPLNLLSFYRQSQIQIQNSLLHLNSRFTSDIEGAIKNSPPTSCPFAAFLKAFRADPQVQSKLTKSLFTFINEFAFEDGNRRKLATHAARIFTRFSSSVDKNSFRATNSKCKSSAASFHFTDSVRSLEIPLKKEGPVRTQPASLMICRKCNRVCGAGRNRSSRKEVIFSANWQSSLWKARCQCGSSRRLVQL